MKMVVVTNDDYDDDNDYGMKSQFCEAAQQTHMIHVYKDAQALACVTMKWCSLERRCKTCSR